MTVARQATWGDRQRADRYLHRYIGRCRVSVVPIVHDMIIGCVLTVSQVVLCAGSTAVGSCFIYLYRVQQSQCE